MHAHAHSDLITDNLTCTQMVKFQIALVSDSNSGQTYALLLYDKIEMNNNCETAVNIGFNAGKTEKKIDLYYSNLACCIYI